MRIRLVRKHPPMVAPFPWFGSKALAAPTVWAALGDVKSYVEPFAGSLAVMLNRPTSPRLETVNDLDCHVINFWRAVKYGKDEVAANLEAPVAEVELFARHRHLVAGKVGMRANLERDVRFYDAEMAAWWAQGAAAWIGQGFCSATEVSDVRNQLPTIGHLGCGLLRSRPYFGSVSAWLDRLSVRLSSVRITCGPWGRIMNNSLLHRQGFLTGVFLDPPYTVGSVKYADGDAAEVVPSVKKWAIDNGVHKYMRIVLAGYDGMYGELPEGWREVTWRPRGGYGVQKDKAGRANSKKERLWLSPHCLDGVGTP